MKNLLLILFIVGIAVVVAKQAGLIKIDSGHKDNTGHEDHSGHEH